VRLLRLPGTALATRSTLNEDLAAREVGRDRDVSPAERPGAVCLQLAAAMTNGQSRTSHSQDSRPHGTRESGASIVG